MSRLERITITVPEKMAARLRDWVDAGEYATTSELVREALRAWADKQDRRDQAREQLRAEIAEGEAGPFRDGEDFFDELEARLQQAVDAMPDAA